jgi:hypothetical protein
MAIAVMEEQDLQALMEKAFVNGMEKGTELTISLIRKDPIKTKSSKKDNQLVNQKQAAKLLKMDVRTFGKHHFPHLKKALVGARPKLYLCDIEELKSRLNR